MSHRKQLAESFKWRRHVSSFDRRNDARGRQGGGTQGKSQAASARGVSWATLITAKTSVLDAIRSEDVSRGRKPGAFTQPSGGLQDSGQDAQSFRARTPRHEVHSMRDAAAKVTDIVG